MRIDQLFSRQELALLTGIDDEVLAFWIKNGLLVPSAGGGGKGSHRKFTGHQINIAGVLSELRNFGINLAGLRAFVTPLQSANALVESAECNYAAIPDALDLRRRIDDLRNYRPVRILDEDGEEQLAKSVEDIVHHFDSDPRGNFDTLDNIASFVDRITAQDIPNIELIMGLIDHGYARVSEGKVYHYGADKFWLALRRSEDQWSVFGASDSLPSRFEAHNFRSGVYLSISNIIQSIWGDRIEPILFHELELTPEDKAKVEKIAQRVESFKAESAARHAAKVLRAAVANAAKLGIKP